MNHYKKNAPICCKTNECGIPNPVPFRYVGVWNEDKQEWQTLQCSEQLYKALQDAREKLKKETFREPYIVIKNGKLDAVLGQT